MIQDCLLKGEKESRFKKSQLKFKLNNLNSPGSQAQNLKSRNLRSNNLSQNQNTIAGNSTSTKKDPNLKSQSEINVNDNDYQIETHPDSALNFDCGTHSEAESRLSESALDDSSAVESNLSSQCHLINPYNFSTLSTVTSLGSSSTTTGAGHRPARLSAAESDPIRAAADEDQLDILSAWANPHCHSQSLTPADLNTARSCGRLWRDLLLQTVLIRRHNSGHHPGGAGGGGGPAVAQSLLLDRAVAQGAHPKVIVLILKAYGVCLSCAELEGNVRDVEALRSLLERWSRRGQGSH